MTWCIFRVYYVHRFQITMLSFILHAMLKQIMPRLTCLFLNGIWVKGILRNLLLRWTWSIGNLVWLNPTPNRLIVSFMKQFQPNTMLVSPNVKFLKSTTNINLGYLQLWKNQQKLRNCMWNWKEAVAVKMCPSIRNIETNSTNWFDRQSGGIFMMHYWNTVKFEKVLASDQTSDKQKEIHSCEHQV